MITEADDYVIPAEIFATFSKVYLTSDSFSFAESLFDVA